MIYLPSSAKVTHKNANQTALKKPVRCLTQTEHKLVFVMKTRNNIFIVDDRLTTCR